MSVQIFKNDFAPLSAEKLIQWASIPPAIAGDVMNRQTSWRVASRRYQPE